jgi:thiamine-monophosphate kinase
MELEFITWLRERTGRQPHLPLGLGDDAAILQLAEQNDLVLTSDLLTEDVHFRLTQCTPQQVGYKALAVNLSDLAAMAARPITALVSIALPRQLAPQLAREIYEGLLSLASQFNVTLAGGDTNCWEGPLVINVALVGQTTSRGPLTRGGAQPGDQLLVTGELGGSLAGRHASFTPRVREALLLHECYTLSAGIDLSDGLALDASRMARESGCGMALEMTAIPISTEARQMARQQPARSPLERALSDGEDFELLLAVPPDQADRLLADQPLKIPLVRIGQCVEQAGLWQRNPDGSLAALSPRGYEH